MKAFAVDTFQKVADAFLGLMTLCALATLGRSSTDVCFMAIALALEALHNPVLWSVPVWCIAPMSDVDALQNALNSLFRFICIDNYRMSWHTWVF